MPSYRIYCSTEGAWVTGSGAGEPTTCYNDAAHTVVADSVSTYASLQFIASVAGPPEDIAIGATWTKLCMAVSNPSALAGVTAVTGQVMLQVEGDGDIEIRVCEDTTELMVPTTVTTSATPSFEQLFTSVDPTTGQHLYCIEARLKAGGATTATGRGATLSLLRRS